MLNLLAVTDYTRSYDVSAGEAGTFAFFSGAFLLVWLVVAVIMIVSMWKIFEKAGRAGWASLIPLYNTWVLAEIAGKPGWWALVFLLAWIPVLGPIAALIVSVILSIELAKSFGKEPAYAALLILLPIVGYPMLGFGDAKYVGAGGKAGTPPAKTPVDKP
jgi:hypothetical protein